MTEIFSTYGYFCFFFQLELIFGEGALLIHFPRKNRFPLRLSISVISYYLVCFLLFWLFSTTIPTFYTSIISVSFWFIIIWLITYVPIFVSFSLTWKEILFVMIAGYSFQHGVYSLLEPLKSHFTLTKLQSGLLFDFLAYIPFIFVYYFIYSRKVHKNCEIRKHSPNFLVFAGFLLLSADVFNVYVQFHADFQNATDVIKAICHLYSFLISFSSLLLLYSFTRMNRLEQDNQVVELLLESERKRMVQEKNNQDVINRKVHDLKHMMNLLNSSLSTDNKRNEIDEINKTLANFEENIHTGNQALDSVLISRKRLCDKENISLSIIADGTAIDFMDYVDVLYLFSNMLDNAIDGVSRLKEQARNNISLKMEKTLNQVFIHLENDCRNDVIFDREGLPVTSSNDKTQHGFGIKSIRYLVTKYHGHCHIYVDKGKFIIDILLPTEQKKNQAK